MPEWIYYRREMDTFINGDRQTRAQGQWIVLRIFRIGQFSQYWNEARQEAIGGPKYNYDDYVVRAVTMPAASILTMPKLKPEQARIATAGWDDVNATLFGVNWSECKFRDPIETDLIYTIDKFASKEKPAPPYVATGRYDITGSIPAFGDNGQIEYYLFVGTRSHGAEA